MKKFIPSISLLMLFCCFTSSSSSATTIIADSTGLPGDHFSLEGAIELFKKSNSLEDFEKKLNKENSDVNNLDLNEDGKVDYIRVIDNMDNDVHAIVLQVPVNEVESQDVAVIEIEKNGEEEAMLQIVGNEDLYGEEDYVEPYETKVEGSKRGPAPAEVTRIVVNVWFWPSVRYIYGPRYRVWVSPYRWGYYPNYWRPWRPRPWRVHYTRCAVYRPSYRVVTTHRVVRAHRVYTPVRRSSTIVRTKTTRVTTVRKANGKVTGVKSNKTVVGKNANGTAVKRTSTTVGAKKTKNGVVAGKKTTQTTATKNKKVSRTKSTKVRKNKKGSAVKRTKTTKVSRKRN